MNTGTRYRLTWIIVRITAVRISPFHARRLFTIDDVALHFSNAAKCSAKARRHPRVIDRPLVKRAHAIYLAGFFSPDYDLPTVREVYTNVRSQVAKKLYFFATKKDDNMHDSTAALFTSRNNPIFLSRELQMKLRKKISIPASNISCI